MANRSPPFAALRALEAASRHRSYSAAAAELDITHSAISQAVKRLEDEVGAKLFIRTGSAMLPTRACHALASAYADAAQTVASALGAISWSSPGVVSLAAPARIARMWLTPLLPELNARLPEESLLLRSDDEGTADTDQVDLVIRSAPPKPGQSGRILFEPLILAYASPDLQRRRRFAVAADLYSAPLLIERDGGDWAAWFAEAGEPRDRPLQGVRFDDQSGLALEAALRGGGVALGDSLSTRAAVRRGELTPVCPDVALAPAPLWILWRRDHPRADVIAALAEWLCGEAGESAVLPPTAQPTLARLSA